MPTKVKLTAKTFSIWKDGFLLHDLPQTFRDAVRITRALGIPYLWIDTLCIMQDSQEDWAKESSRMASIYTNVIPTIGADQFSDCYGGIFGERMDRDTEALAVQLPLTTQCSSDCQCCTIYARRHRSRSYPFLSHAADSDIESTREVPVTRSLTSGLHSRGWTMQERLLSKRMLHLTPFEMAWECTKEVSCECRLWGSVPKQFLVFRRAFVYPINKWTETECQHQVETGHDNMLTQIHGPLVQEARGNMSSIVHLHWQLVVLEFSARCLTVETDRLTALAGIADRLCRVTSQQYYYGILSDHAVRGLLWRHKPNPKRKQASHRLPVGSAPSWSFGSVAGKVGLYRTPRGLRFSSLLQRYTIFRDSWRQRTLMAQVGAQWISREFW